MPARNILTGRCVWSFRFPAAGRLRPLAAVLLEPVTIEQFATHIKAQREIWGQAIRHSGIPAE